MSVRAKFIDQKSATAWATTHILNINGVDDPGFVVDRLILRVSPVISAYTSGSYDYSNLGGGLVTSYWRKTNNVMINNASFRALDILQLKNRRPAAIQYDVLTTQTPTAADTNYFDFPIHFRREQSARPADGCVSLSEIGQFQVTLPAAPLSATTTSIELTLIALGHDAKPGEYVAGVHWRFDELTGDTGNYVHVDCYGNKVSSLWNYSIDHTGGNSPIGGDTNPRVQIDGKEVVNFRGFTCADTPWLWNQIAGDADYADYMVLAGSTNGLVGDLLPSPFLAKIGDYPQARTISIDFGARLATPSDDRFCLSTLYPSQDPSSLAQRVPGAAGIPGETMAEIAQRKGASGGSALSSSPFLPVTVKT